MMAAVLPLLAVVHGIIAAGAILCLVSIAYAFTLNPTSAELGNAVDRRGLDCYAAVYAVYNIAYSLGMMGTDAFAAAIADQVSFLQALLMVSALILVCVPIFLLAGAPPQEPVPEGSSAAAIGLENESQEES